MIEKAHLNSKPVFRKLDENTVEFRGQKFPLKSIHTGHQGLTLADRKRRLRLMEIE